MGQNGQTCQKLVKIQLIEFNSVKNLSSTHETTTFAGPLYPTISIVGNVLFSVVEVTPAIDPADLPSMGNLNRTLFSAGCSTILTSADGYRPPGLFIGELLTCLE